MEQHIKTLSLEQRAASIQVTILFNSGEKTHNKDIQVLSRFKLYNLRPAFIGHFIFHIYCILLLLLKGETYHMVHIAGDWSSFFFGRIYRYVTKAKRVIFSMHGSLDDYSSSKLNLLTNQLKKADAIYATGYDTFKKISSVSNAYFQPSGVSRKFYQYRISEPDTSRKIITVSNLFPKKNIETIISIASALPNYVFEIIGEGTHRVQLEELITKKRVSNINLIGRVPKEIIPTYLANANLFLFTSLWEGTPTVVLEAMAVGLPVISSDAGGLSHIFKNNRNGYIVKNPYDVESYIDRINHVLYNRKIYRELSENNKEDSIKFNWNKVAKRLTNIMLDG